MKNVNNFWLNLIYFLLGAFVCYLALQIELLNINTEINVPELLISIVTALVGLYIANTIQKKITKSQNQYSFIGGKLDTLWSNFNTYSNNYEFNSQIQLSTITSYHKNTSMSIDFLKNIFSSFQLDLTNLKQLENGIDALEVFLTSQQMQNNTIALDLIRPSIQTKILVINKYFSSTLRQIHNL